MKTNRLLSLILLIAIILPNCYVITYAAEGKGKTGNWNFNETTGLINMPTARVIDYRTAKISIRLSKMGKGPPLKRREDTPKPGPATGTIFDSDYWIDCDGDRRLLFSPIRNVEINIMNIHSYMLGPVIAAKWQAVRETKNLPAIALGVHNALKFKEDVNVQDPEIQNANSKMAPFIVTSKSFFKNDSLDLSVGIGGGRFRKRVFYGGELFFDKRHLFSAVGEYDGNISGYGIKYRLPKGRWDFAFVIQDKDSPGMTFNYNMPW